MTMSENSKIKVFQIHQAEFSFLGNENILVESSDFGSIWGDFFTKGGYDPILPYAADSKPVNIWYTNKEGQNIYFQGLFVNEVDKVPEGYKLVHFPAGDFLVVTTEWMATNDEAVGEDGNGLCNRYAETVQIPEGYIRDDGIITKIEKENSDTPDGSRYEVWIPIKKC